MELHVTFPELKEDTALFDLIKNIRNVKPLKPEIKIDDVQIACQIGSGKFSDVFLAIVGPDCYALKIFKPYYQHRYEEERDTLLLLTMYYVPNIPRLIQTFTIPESRRKALLMDLMYEHYDIAKIRELSIDVKIAIIYKILLSLSKANQAGIIHGNICPNNILIDSSLEQLKYNTEGQRNKELDLKRFINVLIVGWNISIRSQDSATFQRICYNKSVSIQYKIEKKDIKIFGGNDLFKSPELLVHKKSITSKVDIWSVGCLFAYFLIDDKNLLWGKKDKNSGLPNDLAALRRIAVKMGPEEVLKSCKDFIPPEHIGTFSSISANQKPFNEVSKEIISSIYQIIIKELEKKVKDIELLSSIKSSFANEYSNYDINNQDDKDKDNKIWSDFYCSVPKAKSDKPDQIKDLISSFTAKQKILYNSLMLLIQRCICVSEYTRFNIISALEQITTIRDNLTDFQRSLNNLLNAIFPDEPELHMLG